MIKIKGVNGNLLVVFDAVPFADAYRALDEKLRVANNYSKVPGWCSAAVVWPVFFG